MPPTTVVPCRVVLCWLGCVAWLAIGVLLPVPGPGKGVVGLGVVWDQRNRLVLDDWVRVLPCFERMESQLLHNTIQLSVLCG